MLEKSRAEKRKIVRLERIVVDVVVVGRCLVVSIRILRTFSLPYFEIFAKSKRWMYVLNRQLYTTDWNSCATSQYWMAGTLCERAPTELTVGKHAQLRQRRRRRCRQRWQQQRQWKRWNVKTITHNQAHSGSNQQAVDVSPMGQLHVSDTYKHTYIHTLTRSLAYPSTLNRKSQTKAFIKHVVWWNCCCYCCCCCCMRWGCWAYSIQMRWMYFVVFHNQKYTALSQLVR